MKISPRCSTFFVKANNRPRFSPIFSDRSLRNPPNNSTNTFWKRIPRTRTRRSNVIEVSASAPIPAMTTTKPCSTSIKLCNASPRRNSFNRRCITISVSSTPSRTKVNKPWNTFAKPWNIVPCRCIARAFITTSLLFTVNKANIRRNWRTTKKHCRSVLANYPINIYSWRRCRTTSASPIPIFSSTIEPWRTWERRWSLDWSYWRTHISMWPEATRTSALSTARPKNIEWLWSISTRHICSSRNKVNYPKEISNNSIEISNSSMINLGKQRVDSLHSTFVSSFRRKTYWSLYFYFLACRCYFSLRNVFCE